MKPEEFLEIHFPRLAGGNFRIASPFDGRYNCVAFAAGDTRRNWDPVVAVGYYWPEHLPRDDWSVGNYRRAFEWLGYVPCENEAHEEGYEKVALFAQGGCCTHVARQISPERWKSKLGRAEDIQHGLRDLEGDEYGTVELIMKRRRKR